MLVLCSNGLSSDTLVLSMRDKLCGCKTAALVVTADNEYKENNYHVQRCVTELESLNLNADLFDLDKQAASDLLSYDVVEFIGGNPYYLLQAIRNSHAESVLRDIAENKVLIGWSAAVFVFSPTLELVNRYTPKMNFVGLTDLTALRLTDIEVLPHYNKFLKRFDQFEEQCLAYEEEHHVKVVRLNDGDGVIVDSKNNVCRVDG